MRTMGVFKSTWKLEKDLKTMGQRLNFCPLWLHWWKIAHFRESGNRVGYIQTTLRKSWHIYRSTEGTLKDGGCGDGLEMGIF